MLTLAQRVARRVLADMASVVQRIEAIPGWDRSNFLRSIHDQVQRGRNLSPKQLEVIEKIEKTQAGRPASPTPIPSSVHVKLDPRKKFMSPKEFDAVIHELAKHPTITVYDPHGVLVPQSVLDHVKKQLVTSLYGLAEDYDERNADEDRESHRRNNEAGSEAAVAAARALEGAKMHATREGVLTTVTMTPSYQEILRHHGVH